MTTHPLQCYARTQSRYQLCDDAGECHGGLVHDRVAYAEAADVVDADVDADYDDGVDADVYVYVEYLDHTALYPATASYGTEHWHRPVL